MKFTVSFSEVFWNFINSAEFSVWVELFKDVNYLFLCRWSIYIVVDISRKVTQPSCLLHFILNFNYVLRKRYTPLYVTKANRIWSVLVGLRAFIFEGGKIFVLCKNQKIKINHHFISADKLKGELNENFRDSLINEPVKETNKVRNFSKKIVGNFFTLISIDRYSYLLVFILFKPQDLIHFEMNFFTEVFVKNTE